MEKYIVSFLFTILITAAPVQGEEKAAGTNMYKTCTNLPSFTLLNCKDKESVHAALNELYTCMKSRFTFQDRVYAEAWPNINVPASGPVTGGNGEWAIACLQAWPCKEGRLAFMEKLGGYPHLAMVSNDFILDYNLDRVYRKKELSQYRMLKVSGLKADQPWFTVDHKKK